MLRPFGFDFSNEIVNHGMAMSEQPSPEVAVFAVALELPADQRGAYLDQACAGDAELRGQVEALLRVHEEATHFFDQLAQVARPDSAEGAMAAARSTLHRPHLAAEKAGDRIGRYKLLQQIGEGGCGVVYMAEQEEPVHRRVALKVIKLGMDTKSVIARFEAERQALAVMDHPNIAKVLEAGATATGRPYFVMELVRGIKITDYCDQHHLSTRERLELFIQVCRAIQHAHQKGIIHRDIKPSNILVARDDGMALPKVIDFGIAKATQGKLTDQTLFTAFEQFMGTPAYMSPEQAEMSVKDIDTRSDIYSLGALLYELLTGRTPFDTKQLLQAGLDEIRRTIREQEPARPSTRLNMMLGADLTVIAKTRNVEPPRLIHLVRGDLDWIVMKALEKDRARRYETANGLAADIQRHIENEPVAARPPSNLYRFQKLIRRNKLAFASVAAAAASLIAGLGVSTSLLLKEKEARQQGYMSEINARNEARRAGRALAVAQKTLEISDLSQASHLSAEGHAEQALPYLVRILSTNPTNDAALTRLTTLLTYHAWMFPLATVTHRDWVSAARFSPDGRRIVTASWDNSAREWDVQTAQPLTPPLPHDGAVCSAVFSPDGRWLATASVDRTARVWDARSGRPLAGPLQHGAEVWSVEFSPDSRWVVTGSSDATARVWDAQTGLARTGPLQHSQAVVSACFSPDGERVLTASEDGTAQLWNAASGQPLGSPMQHRVRVNSAQFSPDGKRIVTASFDGTARVWDALTGKPLTGALQHQQQVRSASFSPDGRWIVTGSMDKTARVWDSWTGQAMTEPLQHDSTVTSVQFSPDGQRILTACEDGAARIWDSVSGQPLIESSTQGGGLWCAQFSPDGKRIVTASRDNTAVVWNAQVGPLLTEPFRHHHYLRSACFSPDGRQIVTASNDKTARVWDALNGTPVTGSLPHDDVVEAAQFSPDGKRIVTASRDHTACLWDAKSGQKLATLKHQDAVNRAHFSPDGQWLVTASSDQTARVWDAASGLPRTEPLRHGGKVWSAQFSPDGQCVATASEDGTARVWDAASGEPLCQLKGHNRDVVTAEFSPDGRWIVTASTDHTARVWDARTGWPLAGPMSHADAVRTAQFSPDGKWIVTASWDQTARVWDASSGLPRTSRLKHAAAVSSARFSPDGKCVLTASDDGTARLWDAESGVLLNEPFKHPLPVTAAEFSPDGKRVVTASDDGTARIWDLTPTRATCPGWLLELAQAVSGQVLNPQSALEDLNVDRAKMLDKVREKLSKEPREDGWAILGRWFLAEPGARTISPFSKITFREYLAHRLEEDTAVGLDELKQWTDLETAESICRETLAESRKAWPAEPARWQSSLSRLVAVLARESKFEQAAQVFHDAMKPSGPPNLLINGSFEFGNFSGSDIMVLFPGDRNITGWTVTGSPGMDFQWIGPAYPHGLSALDGGYFIDLTGLHDSIPYDGISQTIRTEFGRSYHLSFAVGSEAMYDRAVPPTVAVEITGNPTNFFTVSEVGTNRWQTFDFNFTASNATTTLTFTGANTNDIGYIGLDNVIVTRAEDAVSNQAKPDSP